MTQARRPIDLASARVLISNDDGIEAAGLSHLEAVARTLAKEVWVSAPADGHSGASAMVSLRREVTVEPRGPRRFAVTGRPADSLLAALRLTMKDSLPDLVLSGINHGVNIGGDMIYSGTVGVAVTAALNGIPAIALSADHEPGKPVTEETWADVVKHLPAVLSKVCETGFVPNGAFGVNFPARVADPEPVFCRQGNTGDTMNYRIVDEAAGRYVLGHDGGALGDQEGTDLGVVLAGRIGITPITLDRTDYAVLEALRSA